MREQGNLLLPILFIVSQPQVCLLYTSLWLTLLSLVIWYITALAYKEITHSYGADALEIPVSQLLILMGASMAGSMLQLPAVGGGSQMATIATLSLSLIHI